MYPKKKVSTHRRNARRAIQARRPLQPSVSVESDEEGDPSMSISLTMISYSLILSSVASGIVLFNQYSHIKVFFVESSKNYKPSH
jgi:hypothetical protein